MPQPTPSHKSPLRFRPLVLFIPSLIVTLGVLLNVGASLGIARETSGRVSVEVAQQPEATEEDATRAAAKQAYQEGMQLYRQGTAESLRQAIEKFEEALPLFHAV